MLPGGINLETVAIGVARKVQPTDRHTFAVVRGTQESIDHFGIGILRGVGQERIDLLEGRSKSDQVECHTTQQGFFGGLRRELKALSAEFLQEEAVDRIGVVLGQIGQWDRGSRRWNKGPMPLVGCSLIDPLADAFDLPWGQRFSRLRRGHDQFGILAVDTGPDFALGRLSRNDCQVAALASLQGVLVKIQPQVTLPLLSVRSVALEAMLRENRSDIAIEGQRFGGQLGLGIAPMADQDYGQCKAQ